MEEHGDRGAPARSCRQAREFGLIEKDRILNLMLLKSRCLRQDAALRLTLGFEGVASTFFVAIAGAVDSLMFLLINDEANDCLEDRGLVQDLLASIEHDAGAGGMSMGRIQAAIDDMQDLFGNRTDYVVGSAYLDFVVSTYSAFETFMGRVYEHVRLKYPSSESRARKLKDLIVDYNAASDYDKEAVILKMLKLPGDYLSGREKIDFVLSKLPKDHWPDRNQDLNAVAFYANARNSVHNLGSSASKKDFIYEASGLHLIHKSGGVLTMRDRSDIVRLCGELVEIYTRVFACNTDLAPGIFLADAVGLWTVDGENTTTDHS